ncbi:MAG: OmpA family protein [Bacteroidetes bacterium]|nr:OmpA family protein [Bacteroidota bacterium]MBS1929494.1 OmpA family protein [Bacteroidota bacterium]
MKKIYAIAASLLIAIAAHSQILKRIADHAKQKAEQKVNEKIDRSIDDATSKKKNNDSKPVNEKIDTTQVTITQKTAGNSKNIGIKNDTDILTLKTYSKYDFIPGDKVIAFDDFAQDNIGDYPVKWNTNSGGEIVTASGQQGHWLMIKKQGKFIPDYIKTLPDNFTFEYDVICNEKYNYYSPGLTLYFVTGNNGKEVFDFSFIPWEKRSGVKFTIDPDASNCQASVESYENGERAFRNDVTTIQFNSNDKTKLHVSVWRQQQRLRVYLNEEKVFDLPRAFPADKIYSATLFEIWGNMNSDNDRYLIGNIKLSAGAPDTRNKLITEGKFVTRGILFDVNSAVIKPQSYGILKDIANALKENAGVNIKIIGHTDSDGDDAMNMNLSKKRAEAVKAALSQEFGIDASRMQTDGKGETEPVDKNDTPEGKANNRRVEFIKI